MDEQINNADRPENTRRRKRTKQQVFKETYLPAIIAAAAIVLCAVFVITSLVRSAAGRKAQEDAVQASIAAAEAQKKAWDEEAEQLLTISQSFADKYEYQEAITVIDTFTGNIADYPELITKRSEYVQIQSELVLWDDPSEVVNLSFQVLIADPSRAFKNQAYGTSYNRNFVTIGEFSAILEQLYANGYVLVSLDDVVKAETDESGNSILSANELWLPAGKKPLILTQTQVNYYTYMTDGDGDKLPDANGAGFASKLIVDENGNLTNEMIDAAGNKVTGAYDLVPILEAFVKEHPDFSYRGARAILAITGYDGVFGYRTTPSASKHFGTEAYNAAVNDAKSVVTALRECGYDIACYTYENYAYGSISIGQIKADMNSWTREVLPIIGEADIFVFAQNSDIASANSAYSGDRFYTLKNLGFRYYMGFCGSNGDAWAYLQDSYFRMGRLMVSGSNMTYNAGWFSGIFDPAAVLEASRGNVPR